MMKSKSAIEKLTDGIESLIDRAAKRMTKKEFKKAMAGARAVINDVRTKARGPRPSAMF